MTPITFEKNERLMFGCISVTDELFFAYLFVGSQDSQRFWIGKKGKVVGSEAKLFFLLVMPYRVTREEEIKVNR